MAGAVDAFRRLVERAGVPVMPTWQAMDLIEDEHPLYGGRPGSIAPRWANFTLQNCDLLIVLGSRLDMALTAYNHAHFAPLAKKVVVDIDPAEIAKLQMPGRARIAQRLCAPSLLRSLRPGDVLLGWLPSHTPFDQGSLQNVGMHWGSPRGLQYVAKARIERATVTIESEPTLYIESESMNTQFVADENAPATDIAELELPVNLEIATMVLPVEQISSLQPGHVMELPIAIADAQIRLVSYGQTLGYGQLVTVGENFGFQISRMAKQHDADA